MHVTYSANFNAVLNRISVAFRYFSVYYEIFSVFFRPVIEIPLLKAA
jgi:hypothetical protein